VEELKIWTTFPTPVIQALDDQLSEHNSDHLNCENMNSVLEWSVGSILFRSYHKDVTMSTIQIKPVQPLAEPVPKIQHRNGPQIAIEDRFNSAGICSRH
jgi:hypothetical protein